MRIVLVLLFLAALSPTAAFSKTDCVNTEGEAVIVDKDIPSAKAEAIARAKWIAIEQVVGVDVKAQTIVQNFMMVDEAISREIKGAVSSFKVLGRKVTEETITVSINACVESTKAKDTVAGLAQNTAISVFILTKDPSHPGGGYQETNLLADSIIGSLADQGYTVIDVAPTNAIDGRVVENAMKSGRFLELRSLMHRFLTNIVLVGKVDYTVSTKKGEDVGYGLSMPFNNVTARLNYRILSRNTSGTITVLDAGTEQAKGVAGNVEDAASLGLQQVAEKITPTILEKVAKHLKGVTRKVQVKVVGISDLRNNFEIKEDLQNIAWVTEVEDRGVGEFTVSYPENPIYLANSLTQKGKFRIEQFTPYAITMKYKEP